MIGRMWAIALNTFREAARIRVLYVILIVVVAANFLAAVVGNLSMGEEARVARDFGLAGISLSGSLIAIFLGVFLLYGEVQKRTIYTIVSKPIARWEFVVGKYAGMVLVLTVLVALFSAAMAGMLALRSVAITASVTKAIVLAWCEVITVAAIAVFFSAFSSPYLSGLFALSLFAIGRVTPDLRNAVATSHTGWIRATARLALAVVPDLHLFSVSGQTVDGRSVSVHGDFVGWDYVGSAAAHGLLWSAALLVLACVIFRRRDFV
ncbi:MAG TPA: ABC transporter permease [Kofleriaceae bacterium]|nr:ABC transporter permease [Kofleriaceae bacterium]